MVKTTGTYTRERQKDRPRNGRRAASLLAQAMVASIALVADLGKGPIEILILNGFFVLLFVGSALLFRRASVS